MSAEQQLSRQQCDVNREKQQEQSTISSQKDSRWALSGLQRKSLVLGQNYQWLKGYIGQNIDQVEQKFRERCTERQKAMIANYYKRPMESLDPTGERASEEVKKMIHTNDVHKAPMI
ncbi:MAG: hypothetical protein EZS28_031105 [Streblomastix strix]|uniref:Uncharacterized protein n=1 Tax=Streblomastix strix TaxID=222440 RepID=A0A5J4USG9_9EUKA|nr:MAG: hypothetical protein EZS28_031105 [Streblomastix strix]